MTFHLVLDATAVAAYATGSIHVGEVLAEAADDHGRVAVPFDTLILACADGCEAAAVKPLVALRHVEVVNNRWSWQKLGVAAHLLGGVDRAWAALLADSGEAAFILTAEPEVYGGLDTIGI